MEGRGAEGASGLNALCRASGCACQRSRPFRFQSSDVETVRGLGARQVAFPSGSMERPGKADMSFMRELLQLIEREGVPAPAPIEQRWTAGSSASLSIAADPDPDSVHSWVRTPSCFACAIGSCTRVKSRVRVTRF
jgi:hypothetical protein